MVAVVMISGLPQLVKVVVLTIFFIYVMPLIRVDRLSMSPSKSDTGATILVGTWPLLKRVRTGDDRIMGIYIGVCLACPLNNKRQRPSKKVQQKPTTHHSWTQLAEGNF